MCNGNPSSVSKHFTTHSLSHAAHCMYSPTRHSIKTSDTLESEASLRKEECIAPPKTCNTGRLPKQQKMSSVTRHSINMSNTLHAHPHAIYHFHPNPPTIDRTQHIKTHSDILHATQNTLPVSHPTRTRSGLTPYASTYGTERSISRYILISYTLLNKPYKSDTLCEHARDRMKYLKTLSDTSYTLLNIPYQSDTLREYALDWHPTSTHDMTHK